eukprot:TRINITY_DN255_c0_g1_i2.p1 TRINITY_DN255_c0_g1~~TRINITY_DN255_c0_g1_i2.p1  ORF type:complete len:106 (-),score=3.08 TRINITY_DN255_c0_g1_i2:254-571(-)
MRSGIMSRSKSESETHHNISPSEKSHSNPPPSNPRSSRRTHESSRRVGHAFPPDMCEVLTEKDRQIQHMTDKLEILELKVQKLEQLLRLKDSKIEVLQTKLMRQC